MAKLSLETSLKQEGFELTSSHRDYLAYEKGEKGVVIDRRAEKIVMKYEIKEGKTHLTYKDPNCHAYLFFDEGKVRQIQEE